ncbi:MAG: hypothetical protein E7031_02410 [Akkermansiaceae bacterium]|nr:hypothetical protein [Akkermansiaceae bacterium]
MNKTTLLAAATAAVCALSSCRTHIGSQISESDEYKAACNLADVKPGARIFAKSGKYYLELPRYRKGQPLVNCLFNFSDTYNSEPKYLEMDTMDYYRIPSSYAHKLTTGKTNFTTNPADFHLEEKGEAYVTKNAEVYNVTSTATMKDVYICEREVVESTSSFKNVAGIATAIVVDLPATLALNTALLGGFVATSPALLLGAPFIVNQGLDQQQQADEKEKSTDKSKSKDKKRRSKKRAN